MGGYFRWGGRGGLFPTDIPKVAAGCLPQQGVEGGPVPARQLVPYPLPHQATVLIAEQRSKLFNYSA